MDLIVSLDDERLKPTGVDNNCYLVYANAPHDLLDCSLRAALEWKQGAQTCISGLENRIKEIENQFTEYAHDSQIKRDAALRERDEARERLCRLADAARKYMAMIEHPDTELAKVDLSCDPVKVVNDILTALSSNADLEQQVRNLEEYMLQGVAFRDELQVKLAVAPRERDAHAERVKALEEAIQQYYDALMALPDDVSLPPCDATILYFKARRKLLGIGEAELRRRAGEEGG